jgi:hypothetical protein
MRKLKLSNDAKKDLCRIYHYGCKAFSQQQADTYFHVFLPCLKSERQTLIPIKRLMIFAKASSSRLWLRQFLLQNNRN